MKNWFTKLLAGLLAVMMLMSSSVAFMEEMPEAQDTVVEETASVTNEAITEDSTMEPMDELIAAKAFEADVSETEDVDLDEADSANLGDVLDLMGEDQYDAPPETTLTLEAGYEERFTDPEFRAWVLNKYDGDNSGSLDNTELAVIRAETVVDLSKAPNKDKIISLKGIDEFYDLQTLNVSGCSNLNDLFYGDRFLKELIITGCTNLTTLYCYSNRITELNLDDCVKLEVLDCTENDLKSLDISKLTVLKRLSCSYNSLTSLDVRNNTELVELICDNSKLSSLTIGDKAKLGELWVQSNPLLSTIDISGCPILIDGVKNGRKEADPGYGENSILYEYNNCRVLLCDQSLSIITEKPTDSAPTPDPSTVSPAPAAPAPVVPAEPITIAKTPASTKAKAKKGKVTVTWKKIKKTKKAKAVLGQIKSVQVQYSTDPNFATDVNTKTVGKKKTKVTLSLQRKTQYYVRVRYVGTNGYSAWGAVKAVKTK